MNRITFPLSQRAQGATVADLHAGLGVLLDEAAILDHDGAARDEFGKALVRERTAQLYGPVTAKIVAAIQQENHLEVSGAVDERTATLLNQLLEKFGPVDNQNGYTVDGRVTSRASAAVGGLRVRVVDKGVGGEATLAETVTDPGGGYRATFGEALLRRRGKDRPDLQVQVYAGDSRVAASQVRYGASHHETFILVVQADAAGSLASEHETLTGALGAHYQGRLAELDENEDRQDITYLANKAGWDARAVALAALADRFSAATTTGIDGGRGADGIDPPFFYALFRAGLPANDQSVYRTDPATVQGIWTQALKQGVIPAALKDRLPAAVEQFRTAAAQRLLDGPPLAGASSFHDVLAVSLPEDAGRRQVADLYVRHADDRDAFWDAVRAGLGAPVAQRLQVDGQLAYLTLNNAPLIGRLHGAAGDNGLGDPRDLARAGLHRPDAWRRLLADAPIPPEIAGRDDNDKRQNYATFMAAQIRLSYPTTVVAQMVGSGETPVGRADGVRAFLTEHDGTFEIGLHPVAQFVARHQLDTDPQVVHEIARVQRVYQITPDDTALNALLHSGVDSAYAVSAYERDEFVRAFGDSVGGADTAAAVHAKAQQVYAAVLNVALSFLAARTSPGVGVHSPASIVDPAPSPPANASDVLAYATLESLFGDMDYCDCEQCRTILSPAAYLVDLLLFLDRPAGEIPKGFTDPQQVLLDRRPDLQHLPLTCENTNTPVPYIDLVNEVLEQYVTHAYSLAGYTGHDTDAGVPSEELLAGPQFVSDAAYAVLADSPFPPPLPFHQPLELLRRLFAAFDAPLPRVMEALATGPALDRADLAGYGLRDVWMEQLRLSRPEYRLLTEPRTSGGSTDVLLTLKELAGFDDATPDVDVLAALADTRTFCRRLDIDYRDLTDILRTRFVNRSADLIPRLERLGVPFATLRDLKNGAITPAQFADLISPGIDPGRYDGDIAAWVTDDANFRRIMGIVTLTDPSPDPADRDALQLRYADPDPAANALRPFEFIRLIRFVRLWRTLGWTVAHTDKAVTALYPAAEQPDDPDDRVNLDRLHAGLLAVLPPLGVLHRTIEVLGLDPRTDLLPLLACVAPIDTHGPASLYRQMFLGPSALDAAFADDGYGNYLQDPAARLLEHAGTLRAAFALRADEFDQIAAALGDTSATPLTVDTVSDVFRHGWLARKLRLTVRELLGLVRFTGLTAFGVPDPVAPGILRLADLVGRLRAVGLPPAQAQYLIWNQDLTGRSVPGEQETTDLARVLRRTLAGIDAEFALVDDPDGTIARARMTLVYDGDTTDFFFGLLDGTFATTADYGQPDPDLPQPLLDAAAGRLRYDNLRKKLTFTGVLDPATRVALKAVPGVDAGFPAAVDALYAANQAALTPFFSRYPELAPLYAAYAASTAPVTQRRNELLAAFLPELRRRRKRQQTLQSVSAAAAADVALAGAVLDDPAVLHAAGDPARSALDDLTAAETPGLTATFFDAATATGASASVHPAEAQLAYLPGPHPLPGNGTTPGDPVSAVLTGFLEVPETGFYNIAVQADAGATVTLSVGDAAVTLADDAGTWGNTTPIPLRADVLAAIRITVENVRDTVVVRWQSAGRGWDVPAPANLYPAELSARLRAVYLRFRKAATLAGVLKLSPAELAHLAADADLAVGGEGWLNQLPITGDPADPGALYRTLLAVCDFAAIKAELSPDDERLLAVLRAPVAADVEQLTGWPADSVTALLTRFGATQPDLAHLATFRRVHDAQGWAAALGVTASALIAATTNDPAAPTVRDLQAALRARFDPAAWLTVLRPINDEMRAARRDALVAQILHRMRSNPASAHIDTADKLFEFFLMDVEMDPTILTSRIRHALSSVQLFVERCLMNLEPRVSPASLKAAQWEWMKRYRVWEANRRVFIHPENYLYEELRDDQSPVFKETMSELLQGDITEDRAATAFVGYLTKLEEIAKLETCGMFYEQQDPGVADDVVHLVGRTAGAKRKYFYRRREYGSWLPWEKITLDIDDNPVLPVVWRNRLFLFWLKLVQETQATTPDSLASGTPLANVDAAAVFPNKKPRIVVKTLLSWSELLNGTWQPARTSDPAQPLVLGTFDLSGTAAFDRSKLQLSALFFTNDSLRIIVSTQIGQGSSFFLHNAFSTPELRSPKKEAHFAPKRTLDTSTAAFKVSYAQPAESQSVLTNSVADSTTDPHQPLSGQPWEAPFFYSDARYVFYVTTDERLVPVRWWKDIGVVPRTKKPTAEIPKLVFPPLTQFDPGPGVPVTRQPGFGAVDPSPLEYFVTEDAYLNAALGTPGTVRFGTRDIGPSGSQFTTPER
jgi:hypothetical protein